MLEVAAPACNSPADAAGGAKANPKTTRPTRAAPSQRPTARGPATRWVPRTGRRSLLRRWGREEPIGDRSANRPTNERVEETGERGGRMAAIPSKEPVPGGTHHNHRRTRSRNCAGRRRSTPFSISFSV